MFKKYFFNRAQKKINKLHPEVNIILHGEIPSPSLGDLVSFAAVCSKVNEFEKELKSKPDLFFRQKTDEFKGILRERLQGLSEEDCRTQAEKILDEWLPFYFACVREAARRTVGMRHFDVQILGGLVLHKNKIAEMVTGEGKTLVATLSASLNALTGRGVHIITVNDYLAMRDREWMGPVYEFLGFSVGVIQQDMEKAQRRAAYACDITYGTNNEFGFDYLRDNMVAHPDEFVQRGHYYAIVDEVDSILVDEARTPLIISGPTEVSVEKYYQADKAVRRIQAKPIIQSFDTKQGTMSIKNRDGSQIEIEPEELEARYDAIVEEKTHHAYFTLQGEKKVEQALGAKSLEEAPDRFSNPWSHYLTQALRAHYLFHRDKDYIVKDGKVVIVDEFTGRLMPGRRWSDGLHQAVEAKEGLGIQQESQTLATITLQNYFKLYSKLAGMTGTAYTEANEFRHIYKLDVVVVPTNRPLIRMNMADRIYKNKKAKFTAVIEEIKEMHRRERPILVGTTSIEDSEELSFMLGKKGIAHNVLNAKYHEREAHIVAQAGKPGQVTIATNMAGRGTDIVLGGNIEEYVKRQLAKNEITPEDENYREEYERLVREHRADFRRAHEKVVELGGLHVIGTQRHEARRIDNQLRGRCGRQGDPGSSRFYVSLEDDLMRLFGSDRIYFLMDRFGFPEDEPIEHPLINRSLGIAQKKVENHNFEIRKQLLQFDNIMNKQREVVYQQRKEILEADSMREDIMEMLNEVVEKNIPLFFGEERNITGFVHWMKSKFDLEVDAQKVHELSAPAAAEFVKRTVREAYREKEREAGDERVRMIEKRIALWVVDSRWKEHLLIMDSLKEGIHLRQYAHTDPLVEYQKESYFTFQEMIYSIKEGIVDLVFRARVARERPSGVFAEAPQQLIHSRYTPLKKQPLKEKPASPSQKTAPRPPASKDVGRNDPCPCGSGKKYKRCCGR
ncbi:MAG: preprotein translocase subunit SecA [Candidatus Omnitrophica bacterium]|nr:preprotein translocase subunit SecA [Candidatus Omnitrophota bacterium]